MKNNEWKLMRIKNRIIDDSLFMTKFLSFNVVISVILSALLYGVQINLALFVLNIGCLLVLPVAFIFSYKKRNDLALKAAFLFSAFSLTKLILIF